RAARDDGVAPAAHNLRGGDISSGDAPAVARAPRRPAVGNAHRRGERHRAPRRHVGDVHISARRDRRPAARAWGAARGAGDERRRGAGAGARAAGGRGDRLELSRLLVAPITTPRTRGRTYVEASQASRTFAPTRPGT